MKPKSIIHWLADWPITLSVITGACLFFLTGCETPGSGYNGFPTKAPQGSNDVVLKEADVVKISFPSDEKLDTTATIRVDGKITAPLVGEVMAAGKTPAELQKDLINLYSTQLVSSKDITVSVQSAPFHVYITGAVAKPGEIVCNRPTTVLEAIMECGGFEYNQANMKHVRVVRTENGKTHNYPVNLKGIVSGSQIDIFYLRPNDIIYVPSKITWF